MLPVPEIEGEVDIRASPAAFADALRKRVEAGLLLGRPSPRARYRIVEAGANGMRIRAASWWTAIGVGLNDVSLLALRQGSVRYRVAYWRWARFVVGLCGALGAVAGTLMLALDVRGYIASSPAGMLPGLSVEQNLIVAWTMVLFWGFVWPWVLIALYKRPLRRLTEQLVRQVDSEASRGG